MDLTTATPAEIDTVIAEFEYKIYALTERKYQRQDALRRYEERGRSVSASHAQADIDDLNAQIDQLTAEVHPYREEYQNRPWTRAFLVVTKGHGHVHRSRACTTCYPRTQFVWLTDLSGHDEDEIVEKAGERACTVCYPSAPVEVLSRPTQLFSDEEREQQQAREERAAAKAERERKAIEKGITTREGNPLRENLGKGSVIKTERTAEITAVDDAVRALVWERLYSKQEPFNGETPAEWAVRCAQVIEEARQEVKHLADALAWKRTTSVQAQLDLIEAKANTKFKREYGA